MLGDREGKWRLSAPLFISNTGLSFALLVSVWFWYQGNAGPERVRQPSLPGATL